MRGIATVDRRADDDIAAVWLTSRVTRDSLDVTHGNAVLVDLVNDPDAIKKVWSLTPTYAVLATPSSDMDGLPIDGQPLTTADIAALVTETDEHKKAILAAIDDYNQRNKSSLVPPTFAARPSQDDFVPSKDASSQRALATANYAAL